MRAPLALLVLILLAPAGAAQADDPRADFAVQVAPLDAPVRPLQDTVSTTLDMLLPCAGVEEGEAPPHVTLWLQGVPSWANALLSPRSLAIDAAACEGPSMRANGTLILTTTADAPAFTPTAIQVMASLDNGTANRTVSGEVVLEADYFAILDVQLNKSIEEASPLSVATFNLVLSNLGNGRTRVTFEVLNVSEGFAAPPPASIILQSRQQGGNETSTTVPFRVQTPGGFGYHNEVGTASLRITATSLERAGTDDDVSTVSVIVKAVGLDVPAPSLVPTLGALVVALVILARRR